MNPSRGVSLLTGQLLEKSAVWRRLPSHHYRIRRTLTELLPTGWSRKSKEWESDIWVAESSQTREA